MLLQHHVDERFEKLFRAETEREFRNLGELDDVVEAYADRWFYSNPIFIEVVD